MTLYHFGNCLALVYAPYHMAYKYSGISEYSSLSKCVYAGGLYIFTQLCKMLILATFFPDSDGGSNGEYDVFLEICKATVDFADIVGLYFAINSVSGKGHAKILTAAIGWASAEVILTRSVMLWVGARGSEFSWRYVRVSAASSLALVQWSATAALVWLYSRSDLNKAHLPAVVSLVGVSPYVPLVLEGVAWSLSLGPWGALAARGALTASIAVSTLALYAHRDVHINN